MRQDGGGQQTRISGHGNGIAIALAALALVVAGTGTAVAVSSYTVVHIEDGSTAGRFAHVDASGHLSTTGATSTINYLDTNAESGLNFLTGPTTATLEITRIAVQNASANSPIEYELVTTPVSGGACSQTETGYLTDENVPSGGTTQDLFAAPITVKPVASAQYCVAANVFAQAGTTLSIDETLGVQLSAYVANGSYTSAQHGAAPGVKTIVRR